VANKSANTARFGSAPGRVRIIGGSLRGSKLEVLDAPGLRPTPDRVRETLFNWLMPVIEGARCLDLFARGAAAVDFVESDARLVAQLRANLLRLKQTASVHSMSANRFIESTEHHYDIVFIDPPFAENLWESSIEAMEIKSVLSADAWIYVEAPAERHLVAPATWLLHREGHAGALRFMLYRRVMPSAKL
jgi:16S rRNA (guanine966-N2)-methyltransferase